VIVGSLLEGEQAHEVGTLGTAVGDTWTSIQIKVKCRFNTFSNTFSNTGSNTGSNTLQALFKNCSIERCADNHSSSKLDRAAKLTQLISFQLNFLPLCSVKYDGGSSS
jgi:hypothetical protein